jgi:phytoene/squalene synthetase
MTPEQYVEERAAKSGSSFYYAFRFLPPPRRAAITAFYAFCREVDDVVDEVHDPGVAGTKLAWWRKEVVSAFNGAPSHPVMKALMPHAALHAIEPRHLLAVIDGCEMTCSRAAISTLRASLAIATWWPASSVKSRPTSSAAATSVRWLTRTSSGWPCS